VASLLLSRYNASFLNREESMKRRRNRRAVRLVAMLETPQKVEVVLETSRGSETLVFSDPDHDRTIKLIGRLVGLNSQAA